MNKAIIYFGIGCLIIMFAASAYFYIRGKVELKKEQKKNEKQKEKENKIDKEAIENIHDIAGGDIHAGNNILHNLAKKRK